MRLVDLFAGAGLLSYAFRTRGFDISMAVESDPRATGTYHVGTSATHVICADVRWLVPRGPCDVLVGGPPCQGFSTLGKRHPADPRNQLALEFVRWAAALRPRCVVVENVEPFLRAQIWRQLAAGLEDLGYTVTTHSLNAMPISALPSGATAPSR